MVNDPSKIRIRSMSDKKLYSRQDIVSISAITRSSCVPQRGHRFSRVGYAINIGTVLDKYSSEVVAMEVYHQSKRCDVTNCFVGIQVTVLNDST